MKRVVHCTICERPFIADRSSQHLCSDECRAEDAHERNLLRSTVINEPAMEFQEIAKALGISRATAFLDCKKAIEKVRGLMRREDFR